MLKININEKFLKKLKTKTIALALTATMIFSVAGCNTKNDDKKTSTKKTTSTVDTIKPNYTISNINSKINLMTENTDDKFYLSEDDKKTTITILNIDYILIQNKNLLLELYPNGLNSDKEIKDYNTFISKYREYNTQIENADDFLTLSEYTEKPLDKEIIQNLETLTKKIISDVLNDGYKSNIEESFGLLDEFYDNKDININGTIINKQDLSNGYSLASEVYGQIVSIYVKDTISQEKREQLDKKLQAKDSVNRIYTLLEKFGNTEENVINSYIGGDNTYVLDNEDKQIIKEYEDLCNKVGKEASTKGISVTKNEINAAVTIANIDYLSSDYVSAGALKSIIGDREIEGILIDTTMFVNKIENYNTKKENTTEFYKYNIFMKESNEEQVINNIAIKGALLNTYNLRNELDSTSSKQEVLNSDNYQIIKLYNQYSNDISIKGKNGETVTKNDTGMGTRYITDAIYYKALKELPYQFKTINELVDNTDKQNSSVDNISWAIDNKCSEYEFVK